MPILKSELIVFMDGIGDMDMKAGVVKSLPNQKNETKNKFAKDKSVIDLQKALMIKQFLAIKTDHKPTQPIKKMKQDAEVIIILDD